MRTSSLGLLLLSAACTGKTTEPPPPRRLPVSVDVSSLVPEPPDGFTACASLDATSREDRTAAWRSAPPQPLLRLRGARLRKAEGSASYDRYDDEHLRPTVARFTADDGAFSVTFHPRLADVRTAAGSVTLEDEGGTSSGYAAVRHVLAELPTEARIATAGGWVSRGDGRQGDLEVEVYALAESREVVANAVEERVVRGGRDVACSFAETNFQRNAYRVQRATLLDGTRWHRFSMTTAFSAPCVVGERLHVETWVKAVQSRTVVVVCHYGELSHADDCDAIVKSIRDPS